MAEGCPRAEWPLRGRAGFSGHGALSPKCCLEGKFATWPSRNGEQRLPPGAGACKHEEDMDRAG